MNVENKFLRNQIYLQFFLIFNYMLYLSNFPKQIILINFLVIIIFFFNALIDNSKKRLLFIKITIIIYGIISLGSPLIEWDARMIWLFHAKRIFFDGNVYSQFDNYFSISHNDYPLLVASLSSSIAHLMNGWNEILPKFANVFFMTSPFLFLSFILKNKIKEIIFVLTILLIMEKRIIVGEIDMLQSLYFVLVVVCFGMLLLNSANSNKYILIYTILNLIIYSHLRPESFYFSILIFFSALFINFFKKKKIKPIVFIYLSFSFIPIFYWKYLVFYSEITTITQHVFDLNLVWERLFNFYTHFKILELLFYSKNSIISIIFLSYFIFNFLEFDKKSRSLSYNNNLITNNSIAFYTLCFAMIYFAIVYITILGGIDLDDMLAEIGRFRYNLPVSITICYAVIIFNYKKIY